MGKKHHAPEEECKAAYLDHRKSALTQKPVRKPEERYAPGGVKEERPVVLIPIDNSSLDKQTLLKRVAVAIVKLSDEGRIDHFVTFEMLRADHGQTQDEAHHKEQCNKRPAQTEHAARYRCGAR
jgi:hypothetical protein